MARSDAEVIGITNGDIMFGLDGDLHESVGAVRAFAQAHGYEHFLVVGRRVNANLSGAPSTRILG